LSGYHELRSQIVPLFTKSIVLAKKNLRVEEYPIHRLSGLIGSKQIKNGGFAFRVFLSVIVEEVLVKIVVNTGVSVSQ